MGDAAYGDGGTRQAFADAGRTLTARVPGRPDRKHFPKEDFHIDLEAGSCTCPAGNVTRRIRPLGTRPAATGRTYQLKAFQFDGAVCGVCPRRTQCGAAAPGTGQTVQLHLQEALLQQARALQQSEAFGEYRQRRVVVEHRLARLAQLGIRQSRYFGRAKTKFQLYLAATVAVPAPATPSVPGPSVPHLRSSPRGSVKSCPWPCLCRPHCRNSAHSSPRTRLSGQISSHAPARIGEGAG